MRVLALSYDLGPTGGSGHSLRILCDSLAEAGHTAWLVHDIEDRAASRLQPDVVISQQWATPKGSELAALLGVPFAMCVRGPGQYEQLRPKCPRMDLVIYNSRSQQSLVTLATERSVVVHPTVAQRITLASKEGRFVLLVKPTVAKGSDIFCDLADQFPNESFVAVGAEKPRRWHSRVTLLGQSPDLVAFYAQSKIVLVPSKFESYGRVPVEAAIAGTPSLIADTPGLREATRGLYEPVGPGEWASRLRDALANPEPMRRAAAELASRVLKEQSVQLDELERTLSELVEENRATRVRRLADTNPGQMTAAEYTYVEQVISQRAPCALNVYGAGRDTFLWRAANDGGRTTVYETNDRWLRAALRHDVDAVLTEYGTNLRRWQADLERACFGTVFHAAKPCQVALVDGPPGYQDSDPGRVGSIQSAVRSLSPGGSLLVHDTDRPAERACIDRLVAPHSSLLRRVSCLEHWIVGQR